MSTSPSHRSEALPLERLLQRTVEQIVDVPVPQVVEDSVQVVQITPLERISERAVTDCQCASTSDLEEIDNVVRLKSATTDSRAIVDVLILRVLSAVCTRL